MDTLELEQQLLAALGMSGRQDVAEVTLRFSPQMSPRVTVVFETMTGEVDLMPLLKYIPAHYTLEPS
jgi:hypothetical protein